MKKTILYIVVTIFLVTTLFSGCSGAQKQAVNGTAKTAETKKEEPKKPVNMLFAKGGTETIDHEYWVDLIKRYKVKYPHVTIELNETPWADFVTKLNVMIAGGNPPEIVSEAIRVIAQRAEAGQFMPLDDLVNKWDGKADFIPSLLDLGSYKGKLYGLAQYPGPFIYMYRKDFFKEAGLDPEKPPQTWDELLKVLPALTKKNGDTITRAGFVLPGDDERNLFSLLRQNGVEISTSAGVPGWNTPETIETLKFAKELSKYSILINQTQYDQQPPFVNGTAAISQVKPSAIAQMVKDNPNIKNQIGVMELKKKKSSTWAGCEFLFIPTESKAKEEAWNLIKFVFTKEETWNRYKKANIPIVLQSLKDDYLKDDPLINKAIFVGIETGKGAEKIEWWASFMKVGKNMFGEVIFDKKTPEEALKSNYTLFDNELKTLESQKKK